MFVLSGVHTLTSEEVRTREAGHVTLVFAFHIEIPFTARTHPVLTVPAAARSAECSKCFAILYDLANDIEKSKALCPKTKFGTILMFILRL